MTDWQYAPLNIVCSLVTDGTHHSPENTASGDYKYVTAKNIRPWGLDVSHITYVDAATHAEIYARCPAEYGDVLYIKDGVTTGLAALNTLREPISLLSSVALLKPKRDVLSATYLKHWLNSPVTKRTMTEGMTGTAIKRLVLKQIRAAEIPIAPLAEQKRIADKLDTVLTRVDAVNTRLARVAPLLKRFRQSVLAAATSGRLTEDWRAAINNDQRPEYQSIELTIPYAHTVTAPKSWTGMRFDAAIELVGGSQPPKAVFSIEEQDGYVRLIQIRDYKSDKYKTHIPRELARRFCSKTDVMIGRYGPPIFQILRGLEGAYNVALMKAVPRDGTFLNDYLYFMLQRPDLLRYVEAGSDRTAGQDGVNKDHLVKYPVFAPAPAEQTEIVRRVETLFAFADRLQTRLAAAQTAATRLTPALLAKAFRGELVPQDPNDEPAADLLRRLAQASTPAARSTKPRRKTLTK